MMNEFSLKGRLFLEMYKLRAWLISFFLTCTKVRIIFYPCKYFTNYFPDFFVHFLLVSKHFRGH